MREIIRILVIVVVTLVIALPVGYLIGVSRQAELEQALSREEKRAIAAESVITHWETKADQEAQTTARQLALFRAKTEMLKALVQLYGSNFGLASQHMSVATKQLKEVASAADAAEKKRLKAIGSKISEAMLVAGRLDAMARTYVENIVADLEKIPGAR